MANDSDGNGEPVKGPLSVKIAGQDFHAYLITTVELESLQSHGDSPNMGFLGITVGGAVTLFITLIVTPDLPVDVRAYLLAFLVATVLLSVFFAWRMRLDRKAMGREIQAIRSREEPIRLVLRR